MGPARLREAPAHLNPLRRAPAKAPARSRPGRALDPALARARLERLLDGLLRGRLWIALVAVLLFGIVFLNVSLLQRDRHIARGAESVTELKRANERLRVQVGRLGSSERIQRAATQQGFALPGPAEVTYLRSRGRGADAPKALAQLRVGAGGGDAADTPAPGAVTPDGSPLAQPPAAPEPTADAGGQNPAPPAAAPLAGSP